MQGGSVCSEAEYDKWEYTIIQMDVERAWREMKTRGILHAMLDEAVQSVMLSTE